MPTLCVKLQHKRRQPTNETESDRSDRIHVLTSPRRVGTLLLSPVEDEFDMEFDGLGGSLLAPGDNTGQQSIQCHSVCVCGKSTKL